MYATFQAQEAASVCLEGEEAGGLFINAKAMSSLDCTEQAFFKQEVNEKIRFSENAICG